MKKFLKHQVNTIFIMLGNSCNLNCVYCLQHALVHHQIATKINPDIYDFIKQVALENGNNTLTLQFFGGEPLLYFNQIKEIVKTTESISNIAYSIITNGKLIDDKMVEFFNKHDFHVSISWDGKNVLKTRHFDAFDPKQPLRRRLMRINSLGISGVISSEVYPIELLEAMEEISKQYFYLHNEFCYFNLDEVFDTGLDDKCKYIIENLDLDRIYNEMTYLTNRYIETTINKKNTKGFDIKNYYIRTKIMMLKKSLDTNNLVENLISCRCGNGMCTLNLDLDGNLYQCHNVSEPVSSIYESFNNYISKIYALDKTKERVAKRCKDCPVVYNCKGGCKLITDEVLDKSYCNFTKAMYYPILECLQKYGEKING